MFRFQSFATAMILIALVGEGVDGQIRVHPTGVNVSTQGATTVFLSYGGVAGYEAVEGMWCGALLPATPAIGLRCDPATIFGTLPLRYDWRQLGITGGLTDVMTIPPSVVRRAYQDAERGAQSSFYYVRRFRSVAGRPDEYVAVTCRLAGGGARTPLSLTSVELSFATRTAVLQVAPGDPLPTFEARIAYTGSGHLVGRWEVVLPGEPAPDDTDLRTEASLPMELRGAQRRYATIGRFNVFLPPTGMATIPGPDPSRLPTSTGGVHQLLMRVEATSDKEGDSNLAAAGAGAGTVPSGGVAGFALPTLRYMVGSGDPAASSVALDDGAELRLARPLPGATLSSTVGGTFVWVPIRGAATYRVEFSLPAGERKFAALVSGKSSTYRAPPWLATRIEGASFRWRVVGVSGAGYELTRSRWHSATFAP